MPGDILAVRGNNVNMRTGPSTNHPVMQQVHRGQELVELQRHGPWVQVMPDKAGGPSGWIHATLVKKDFRQKAAAAPKVDKFQKFQNAFDALNENIRAAQGKILFVNPVAAVDSIINVTATDQWLSLADNDRERHLRDIFEIWDTSEGTGLPISVNVMDQSGKARMIMLRDSQGRVATY